MIPSDTVCNTDACEQAESPCLTKLKCLRKAAEQNGITITTEKRRSGLVLTVFDRQGRTTDRLKVRRLNKKKGTARLTVKTFLRYDPAYKAFVESLMGTSSAKGGFRVKWNAEPVRLDLNAVLDLLIAMQTDREGLETALNAFFDEQMKAVDLTIEKLNNMKRKELKAKLKTLDTEAIMQAFGTSPVLEVIDGGAVGQFVDRVAYADTPDEEPVDNNICKTASDTPSA